MAPSEETERLRRQLLRLSPAADAATGGDPAPETDDLPERRGLAITAAAERARRRVELALRAAIAVLPFGAIGEDAPIEALGIGLAEDVATELGRFPELAVLAPSSTHAYRQSAIGVERAAAH